MPKTIQRTTEGKQVTFRFHQYNPLHKGRQTILLTKETICAHLVYPQREAANRLGVSLSTLKRRFYNLFNMDWPKHMNRTSAVQAVGIRQRVPSSHKQRRAMNLRDLLNSESMDPKFIDSQTEQMLNAIFHTCGK